MKLRRKYNGNRKAKREAKYEQNEEKRKQAKKMQFGLHFRRHSNTEITKWDTHLRAALPQKEIHINEEEEI